MHRCPLCATETGPFHQDARRAYRACPTCSLVSVPARHHLGPAAERREYELHENDPADSRYRRFLSRAAGAVRARVPPPAEGLDFGCGPAPALSAMLEEDGYAMAVHDEHFAPDPSALARDYDFITATEVLEHLAEPAETLGILLGCLRPGGWLVAMTKRARDRDAFARWHYIRDPTHVVFFSDATFRWIAARHGLDLEIVGPDVIALRRA
ncbi:MAG: class I SAM-dependent methyltransferase [Polyangiales bacterium]